MKKRILSMVLAALMLLHAFPVYAVNDEPTFVVETVETTAGETVDVIIRLENNPGITSIKLFLEYADGLTLVNASVNEDLKGMFEKSPTGKYPIILNWFDGLKDVTGDWTFVTLTFTVAESAKVGTYPVTITYEPNDVFNADEENVHFHIENGGVEVVPKVVAVTGVKLDKTALSLTEGESAVLTATVTPADATNKNVTFTSSDPAVATVDASGKVTAVKAGTAVITAATADGGKTAQCTVTVACGHGSKTKVEAKNPDCLNPGNLMHYICDACGQAFKADGTTKTTVEAETLPATGHDYKTVVTAPTCTEQGYTTHTCANCGDSFVDTSVDALGHSFTKYVSDSNATCEEDGTETAKCDRCDATDTRVVSGSREDAAHSFPAEYTSDHNATCTADGTKSRICTLCGEKETVPDVGSALGHDYKSVVTAPTCTERGYTTHTCSRCDDSYADTHVNALGHDFVNYVSDKNATCTEDGTKTAKCSRCDATDTVVDRGSATGHSYGDWYVTKAATLEAEGEERRDCSRCDAYQTRVIPMLVHSYTSTVTPPTCTEEGYTTHVCQNCGHTYVDTYVPALGHNFTNYTSDKNATCTEDGTKTAQCTRCDATDTITDKGSAKGHSYGTWHTTKAATCTTDGTEQRDCANCDAYETRTVAATGHDYKSVVTAPTCTERGYTTHTCATCGHSYVDSYVNAKGHSYGAWYVTKAATCTTDGTEQRDCANCDAYETRTVAATGHNYKAVVTAPTCTERGYTTHTCATCGHSYVDSYVNAKGHSYGTWHTTKAATCTTDGTEQRDCANCDHYETRVIKATGHDYKTMVTAPTCTEQGYTTHTCANCGDSYTDTYISATGHSYSDWYVTKAATLEAEGEERRDCSRCDAYQTRMIPMLVHSYTSTVTPPTCTEEGYTTHVCQNCGHTYVDTYVPALGHNFTNYTSDKNATCTEDGTKTAQCTRCDAADTIADRGSATGHSYGAWYVTKAATCTTDSTEQRDCANCDAYETRNVAAIGHNYKAVVTAPTCTERGYTTHTCTTCGHSYVDSYVNANGHSYGAWHTTKAATCTTDGTEQRDCTNCDHYEIRVIKATGHDYKSVVTAPTCTERGYTTHTCRNCGHSYVDTYVNAKGHNFVNYVSDQNATCTEDGTKTAQCTRCDATDTVTDKGSAKGHSYGTWHTTKAATCTTDGTEQRDCANCDAYETRTVAATGHNYKAVVTAPTCTERGYTTHTCTTCGHSYVDAYVNAKGHSYGAWYVTKAATCTADGTEQRDCANCDHYETRVIKATGHNYKSVVTAPTCTEQGYTTHTCANCGDSYKDSYTAALGHLYGDWRVIKEATLEAEGEERRDCSRCDAYQTRVIPMLVHSYTSTVTPPTCTEEGYTIHVCQNCGHTYVDTYVPALGHNFTNYTSDKNATCTEDGTKTAQCTRCDATDTIADRGSATGHSYGAWYVTKAATCTTDGTEQRDCANCDAYETRTVAATGHNYKAVVTAPTCTERGYTTHTCATCGHSYVDSYVNAKGHSYGAWYVTKAATCTTDGTEQRDCTNCDAFETRTVAATGHVYKSVVTAPTCTERGYTTHTCATCGHSYVDSYVNAKGHSYGAWYVAKAATCTTDGTEQRDCANCDHYETRVIKATGHDYKTVVTAPTCTEQGYTTHTCANCGDSYKDTYTAATGHKWDAGVVTKQPTEQETGIRLHTCTVCGQTKTEVIPTLDHVHSYEAEMTAPTCTEQGYTTYTCSCGDSYVADYTAALGHDYHGVVTAPTYEAEGYTTYTCARCGDSYVADFVDALIHHDVLEGENTVWNSESGEALAVRIDAAAEDFLEVRINGEILDPQYYTVSADTAEVTIHEAYLKTLSAGKYTLAVFFTTGSASATFHVTDAPVVKGDVNGDGRIDLADAYLVALAHNGQALTDIQQLAADVNSDGKADAVDAYYIVLYYSERIAYFPA